MGIVTVLVLGFIATVIQKLIKDRAISKLTLNQVSSKADMRIDKYIDTVNYSPAQQAVYKRKVKCNAKAAYKSVKQDTERETFAYWIKELEKMN